MVFHIVAPPHPAGNNFIKKNYSALPRMASKLILNPAQWFLRRRFLNNLTLILHFCNYLSFAENHQTLISLTLG
jgi:hypothetical protein